MPGSRRSLPRRSASALVLALLAGGAAEALVPYRVDGDTIAAPLAGRAGDATRGRALITARETSTCLLCHAGLIAGERAEGSVGPSLAGVGLRLSEGQIRLRVVNAAAVNPETVMPSFYAVTGRVRVAARYEGKPILTADQIEDVVAYLATLRAP